MNEINWRAVDLNLLVVFSTLMQVRSVSKAADKLSVGQSAMSHSLSRLRDLLQDPLFIRQGHKMLPSKKALELEPIVSHILSQILHQVLQPPHFEAVTFSGMFKIGLTDYAELLFAPSLYDAITEQATGCQLCFFQVDKANYQQVAKEQQLDLVIGSISGEQTHFNRLHLYTEHHVCLFDAKATGISKPITMDAYLSVAHALASPIGQVSGLLDKQLAKLNLQRKVSVTSANFLTLRHLMLGRKLLCVVPELMARMDLFSHDLQYGKAPMDIPDFAIEMLWEKASEQDTKSIWLRNEVKKTISQQVAKLRHNVNGVY